MTGNIDPTVPPTPGEKRPGIAPPAELPPVAAPPTEHDSFAAKKSQPASRELVPVLDDSAPSESSPTWGERLGDVRNSSWLASAILHLIALLALALLTYRLRDTQQGVSIDGALSGPSDSADLVVVQSNPDLQSSESETQNELIPVETATLPLDRAQPSMLSPTVATPTDNNLLSELQSGGSPTAANRPMYLGGGGMSSRTPEGRKKYGDKFGATSESEAAVENALRWLAEHQRSNGSWSFDLKIAPCDGRCRHGKPGDEDTPTPATAATGLALLSFFGAGYTPHSGPYKDTVQKGLYYLKSAYAEAQYGYDWQQGGSMYGHGIAMMALSEALGMTRLRGEYDTDLLHHVDRGAFFTTTAQHPSGSWGYTPGSPGDTTLTGWQLLSLIGARKAGVQMRSDTFRRTKEFLMSVKSERGYQFGYRSTEPEPTTTAIALTLLMYLGQTPGYTPFDQEIDALAERGPTLTNVYHDYYATMALHHWRHRDWETWNTKLRDHLVRTQATEGHESGSWHFDDRWGNVGGRVYTTAMCTLILEVYYRFLPLYDEPPEFPL